MKITILTSNQPRHLALIERMSVLADEVYAVMECKTNFPGQVADRIPKSPVMEAYFSRVTQAEREVFGGLRFLPSNVAVLPIRSGDLNYIDIEVLAPALASDYFIVFGASYIKGALGKVLVQHRAVNIHMGVAPYYRGNSCNFWALYDDRPDLVGATVHVLSEGLDSGGVLFHAFPEETASDPFMFGMKAVRAAQSGLIHYLSTGALEDMLPVPQDRTMEMRYTRAADFTDEVAQDFINTKSAVFVSANILKKRDFSAYVRPYFEARNSREKP